MRSRCTVSRLHDQKGVPRVMGLSARVADAARAKPSHVAWNKRRSSHQIGRSFYSERLTDLRAFPVKWIVNQVDPPG